MVSCTLEVAGQRYNVSGEELQAQTEGDETFATVSTRDGDNTQMLMQVSAAQGSLLVVATKTGAELGDQEQQGLEDLVDEVFAKDEAETGGGQTGTPETATPTDGPAAAARRRQGRRRSRTGARNR